MMFLEVKFISPSCDSLGLINIIIVFNQLLTIASSILPCSYPLYSLSGTLVKCILGSFHSILEVGKLYNTWVKSGLLSRFVNIVLLAPSHILPMAAFILQ